MTSFQKGVFIISASIILCMLIYPPFIVKLRNGSEINMGYSTITNPPQKGAYVASVNYPLLVVQWVGVLIITALLWAMGKRRNKTYPTNNFQWLFLLRWFILFVAFIFATLLFGLSKEIMPLSAQAGAIRGILLFLFMATVWKLTKNIGKKHKIQYIKNGVLLQKESSEDISKTVKWTCPKCNASNSNDTFKCKDCSYSLL